MEEYRTELRATKQERRKQRTAAAAPRTPAGEAHAHSRDARARAGAAMAAGGSGNLGAAVQLAARRSRATGEGDPLGGSARGGSAGRGDAVGRTIGRPQPSGERNRQPQNQLIRSPESMG